MDADNNLHIEMEKKTDNKEGKKHGRYLRREFSYEKFQQTLLLPEDAEADKIEAKVEKGVLNVHIPKKEQIRKSGRRQTDCYPIGYFTGSIWTTMWDCWPKRALMRRSTSVAFL